MQNSTEVMTPARKGFQLLSLIDLVTGAQQPWYLKVDLGTLDMASAWHCVLAQTYGHGRYDDGVAYVFGQHMYDLVVEYGFSVNTTPYWDALTTEWTALIEEALEADEAPASAQWALIPVEEDGMKFWGIVDAANGARRYKDAGGGDRWHFELAEAILDALSKGLVAP